MTALGGALVRVGDPGLRGRMRAMHGAWPVLPVKTYAQKVAKYAAIKATLQGARRYGAAAAAVESRGHTLDEAMSPLVKGFPGTDDAALMKALRHQPCGPLVALLHRRLQAFDPARLQARAALGERVRAGLGAGLWLPGHAQPRRTHWLVPVASAAPDRLQRLLRQAGFDASVGATSLAVIPPPPDRPGRAAAQAEAMLARMLYVPAYPELGAVDADQLLDLLGRGLPGQATPVSATG
jgi:dTDP-4-amino-4,6-dideoxygalactose transaminase